MEASYAQETDKSNWEATFKPIFYIKLLIANTCQWEELYCKVSFNHYRLNL